MSGSGDSLSIKTCSKIQNSIEQLTSDEVMLVENKVITTVTVTHHGHPNVKCKNFTHFFWFPKLVFGGILLKVNMTLLCQCRNMHHINYQ